LAVERQSNGAGTSPESFFRGRGSGHWEKGRREGREGGRALKATGGKTSDEGIVEKTM